MPYTLTISRADIVSSIDTRGYGGTVNQDCVFDRIDLDARTWNPKVTVETKTDGQDDWETTVVVNDTRDPKKWLRPYGKTDRDMTNANGDQRAPYRQDYAMDEDFDLGCDPDASAGVEPDAMAEYKKDIGIRRQGRYTQVRITSKKGRIKIIGITVRGRVRGFYPQTRED